MNGIEAEGLVKKKLQYGDIYFSPAACFMVCWTSGEFMPGRYSFINLHSGGLVKGSFNETAAQHWLEERDLVGPVTVRITPGERECP